MSGTVATGADTTGAYRWVVLLVAWGAFLVSFVDRLAWGNVALAVSHDLGLAIQAVGVFVTSFYVGYVVSNAVAGVAIDWLGPRTVLALSLLPLGAATWAFGATTSLAMGLALQALMGLTAGADYAAGVKLIALWFDRHTRGRAMGLYMTASSLAIVLVNFAVPRLMPALGWPGVYHALGAITFGMAALAWLVLPRGGGGPAGVAHAATRARPDLRALLRERDLILLSAAGFGALWGTWGFAFWANALMVRGAHVSAVEAGGVVASAGLAALVAKPIIGLASDLLGGRRCLPTVLLLVGFALALAAFAQLRDLPSFALMAPVLGVFAFGYSPLMNTMVAEAAGRALAGSAAGITNAIWALGSVIVPSVVGLVFQASGSFLYAFLTLAIGPALGAVCTLLVRERPAT
jgi:sugar phosphate permease